jgi:hypothetical protein
MHDFARAARVCTLAIVVSVSFSALSQGQTLAPQGSSDDAKTSAETPEASDTEQNGFLNRLFSAYWQDWKCSNAGGPEAPRRIPPPQCLRRLFPMPIGIMAELRSSAPRT